MGNSLKPNYDFDVHPPLSFMHYFTEQYMDETYRAVVSSGVDVRGKTIYDIGMGRGRSLAIFQSLGIAKVIGFEVRPEEAQYAKRQAERLGVELETVLDSFDNDELKKVPSGSVELLAVMNIFFCLDDRTRSTIIEEVKRILKPGGTMIVLDMQGPSSMSILSWLSRKPWKFFTYREFLKRMQPLRLLTYRTSNHFYFANKPMDFINKLCGFNVCYPLDRMARKLHIPSSTRTYIFTKSVNVAA